MKNFKIRASACGQILTTPRKKGEHLSETAKNYLKTWWISEKYGRKQEIKSKYLTKGNVSEEASITILNDYFLKNGRQILLKKNTEFFENEYMTGTPDLIHGDEVLDVKSVWTLFTMPFFDKTCPSPEYYYQLQTYLALTGKKKASLCYVLTNTPEFMIYDEARRESYARGYGGDIPHELEEEIRRLHTYDDIPLEDRIRVFDIPRDDNAIAAIYEKVEACRDFLSRL